MREATLRAAILLGCVWPIIAPAPRPAPRQIFASWVLLPEPVAPTTSVTGCSATARAMLCACAAIGRSVAIFTSGSGASFSAILPGPCAAHASRCDSPRPRRRHAASDSVSIPTGEAMRPVLLIAVRSPGTRSPDAS